MKYFVSNLLLGLYCECDRNGGWRFTNIPFTWSYLLLPTSALYFENLITFLEWRPWIWDITTVSCISGMWDNDWVYWTFSPSDVYQPYKCCSTPPGYYIDYVSCYYLPTHDVYWEYYDGNLFLVNCATGYVRNPAHHGFGKMIWFLVWFRL